MPHKLFDYMTAGLPVIAPDFAPDIVAVLDEADAGLLIDTANPEALADAMEALIDEREAAGEMGQRGLDLVTHKFNWEHDAEKLIAMYCDLLGDPRQSTDQRRSFQEAA